MNMRFWIFLGISVLGIACSRGLPVGRDADGCVVLDLDEALRSAPELKLSDIVSSVEYIPLETSDSCLLSGGSLEFVTDDCILLRTFPQVPALFDRKGRFLNWVGHRGKGPGEWPGGLYDCRIDERNEEILMFLRNLQVLCFDMQGRYLRTVGLPSAKVFHSDSVYRSPHLPRYVVMGSSDRMLYFHFNPDSTRVFMSDTQNPEATLTRLPGIYGVYHKYERSNRLGYGNIHYVTDYFPSMRMYRDYVGYFDGQKEHGRYYRFYYDGRVDTVFRVVFSKEDPQWGLNLSLFREAGDYIVFLVSKGPHESYGFVYDTRHDRLYRGGVLENDVDNGFDFFPVACTPDGQYLCGLALISDLRKQAETSDNPKFRAFVEGLGEDPNPVLYYAKLKEPASRK